MEEFEIDYNSSQDQIIDLDSSSVYKMCHHGPAVILLAGITTLALGFGGYQWYLNESTDHTASATTVSDEVDGDEESVFQVELGDGTIVKTSFNKMSNNFYSKNGFFIQGLLSGIRYTDNRTHAENVLYAGDIATADDISDTYRNNLVYRQMVKDALGDVIGGFSYEQLSNASINLFGKNYYETSQDVVMNCKNFHREGDFFTSNADFDCSGSYVRYYAYTTRVQVANDDVYVYQKVAFQAPGEDEKKLYVYSDVNYDGIGGFAYNNEIYSTELEAGTHTETSKNCFTVSDMVDEKGEVNEHEECTEVETEVANEDFEFHDFVIEDHLDELTEYRYTFTYDTASGTYVFKNVTRV